MKKRLVPYVLTLCLILTGCGKSPAPDFEDSAPMPGFDAQNQYFLAEGAARVQETDGFYCGTGAGNRYLHYYDKASGISGILCWDPACGHDTNECSGYFGITGASLSWYDGALYWIDSGGGNDRDEYLWRDDLSGAGREKIKRISIENVIMEYQPQWYAIHRGKLYFRGGDDVVTENGAGQRISLLCAPLNDFEEFTVLYDEIFYLNAHPTVRFVGNSIYFSVATFSPETFLEDITITKFDIATGNSEVIFEETGIEEFVGAIWVTEQGEIYLPLEDRERGASVSKIEDGRRTEIFFWEGEGAHVYLMDGVAVNLTAQYREDGSRIRHVDIKNYSGETIYSGELFPEGIPGIEGNPSELSITVIGGDTEKLMVDLGAYIDGAHITYMVMLDLSDMTPTILWINE